MMLKRMQHRASREPCEPKSLMITKPSEIHKCCITSQRDEAQPTTDVTACKSSPHCGQNLKIGRTSMATGSCFSILCGLGAVSYSQDAFFVVAHNNCPSRKRLLVTDPASRSRSSSSSRSRLRPPTSTSSPPRLPARGPEGSRGTDLTRGGGGRGGGSTAPGGGNT